MEAGSTTWLSIPSLCRTRWIQNPSSPASWMTMMGKTCPVRARAFSLSRDKRARRAAMSPLGTECYEALHEPADDEQPAQEHNHCCRGKDRVDDGQDPGCDQQHALDQVPERVALEGVAHGLAEHFGGGVQRECHGSPPLFRSAVPNKWSGRLPDAVIQTA